MTHPQKRKDREAAEVLILVLTVIDLVLQPLQVSVGFYFVSETWTSWDMENLTVLGLTVHSAIMSSTS